MLNNRLLLVDLFILHVSLLCTLTYIRKTSCGVFMYVFSGTSSGFKLVVAFSYVMSAWFFFFRFCVICSSKRRSKRRFEENEARGVRVEHICVPHVLVTSIGRFFAFVCLFFRAVWEEACGLPNISVPNSFKTAQEYARVSKRACRSCVCIIRYHAINMSYVFSPASGGPLFDLIGPCFFHDSMT